MTWIISCIFPFFLLDVTGLGDAVTVCRGVTWACMSGSLVAISLVCIAAIWDYFPVPLGSLATVVAGQVCIPLLYFIVPEVQRSNPTVRHRMLFGTLAAFGILGIAQTFLLLNAAISATGPIAQAFIVLAYLHVKLAFEHLGSIFARRLGADGIITFVFLGACVYEYCICIALALGSHWSLTLELTLFDVTENVYHVYSLVRERRQGGGDEAK